MELIDALIATALSLAALATVTTIVMEAGLRAASMRKKNLVQLLRLMNDELARGPLQMTPEERRRFVVGVMLNPARMSAEQLAAALGRTKIEELAPEAVLEALGYLRAADPETRGPWAARLRQGLRATRAGIYDRVSLEQVLRKLAESHRVRDWADNARDALSTELNRLARRHEEFAAAVSAAFRRHAQAWSLAVGVALALGANVDGLRLFEAFLADAGLASEVIANHDRLLADHQQAATRRDQLVAAEQARTQARAEVEQLAAAPQAPGGDSAALQAARRKLATAEAQIEELASAVAIRDAAERAAQRVNDIAALGLPIGWGLYPNCAPAGGRDRAADPRCRGVNADPTEAGVAAPASGPGRVWATLRADPGGFVRWAFAVLVTGLLIGLGAPFWFDVAKRLGQVRRAFGGTASSDLRLAGADADGDPQRRQDLVERVIADAAAEAASSATAAPRARPAAPPGGG